MAEHIVPKKTYYIVFGTLLCLTGATTGIAYIDLGVWNTAVALAIAVGKASLVAIFFMHLRWSVGMTRIVACAAIFWLCIMLALTLGDAFSRNLLGPERGWQSSTTITITHPLLTANKR